MGLKHFLIIPFNAGSKDLEWLKHRIQFFRAFTEPSIVNQTNKNFISVFLIDPSTPKEIKSLLEGLGILYEMETFWAVQREAEEEVNPEFSEFLKNLCDFDEWIVTSRVDNDDGLALDFIEKTQELFREKEEFIIYPNGLMWVGGKHFEKRTVSPPFGTLVELTRPIKTVFYINHGSIPKKDHQSYGDKLMWIHTYHGKNLATKPKRLGPEIKDMSRFRVEEVWLK